MPDHRLKSFGMRCHHFRVDGGNDHACVRHLRGVASISTHHARDACPDFSGVLQQDATVKITSGVSNVRIVVPAGMTAQVDVEGAISNVSTEGTWTVNDKHYEVAGSGPTLTITVQMGVGNLTLVSEGGE